MKKTLLLSAVAAMAMTASAEVVTCWMDNDALGLTSTAETIDGGFVFCENDYAKLTLAFEDAGKAFTPSGSNYSQVAFNGGDFASIVAGVTGSSNPSFTSYADGAPTGGWVFLLDVKKDGYITLLTKMNPKKQYIAFEGKTSPISYTLGVAFIMNDTPYKIEYTLPADEEGYLDYSAADADKYFIFPEGETVPTKPQFPYLVAGLEDSAEGSGFLQFPVYEGVSYYVCALGSKMATNGFVWSDEPISVSYTGTKDEVQLDTVTFAAPSGDTAVQTVAVELDENAPIYNTLGVRVDANAKGILIQNGKKFIRK